MGNSSGTSLLRFFVELVLYGVASYCVVWVWQTLRMLRQYLERDEQEWRKTRDEAIAEMQKAVEQHSQPQ